MKRCIFRRLRKTGTDDADVTWRGRSFQGSDDNLAIFSNTVVVLNQKQVYTPV